MSVSSLYGWRGNVNFDKGMILAEDLIVNGDITVSGAINGQHIQGLDQDNTWTGTQDWSVYRPTVSGDALTFDPNAFNPMRQKDCDAGFTSEVLGADLTFTSAPTFSGGLEYSGSASVSANTDVVTAKYLRDAGVGGDLLTSNNTWGGDNSFEKLPTAETPQSANELAIKSYVDDQVDTLVANHVSGYGYDSSGGTVNSTVYFDISGSTLNDAKAFSVFCTGGAGGGGAMVGANPVGMGGGAGASTKMWFLGAGVAGNPTDPTGVGGTNALGWMKVKVGNAGLGQIACSDNASGGNSSNITVYNSPYGASSADEISDLLVQANGGAKAPNDCLCNVTNACKAAGGTFSAGVWYVEPYGGCSLAGLPGKKGVNAKTLLGYNTAGQSQDGATGQRGKPGGATFIKVF